MKHSIILLVAVIMIAFARCKKNDTPGPAAKYPAEKFTGLVDGIGELNVVKATMTDKSMPADSVLNFTLYHNNTYFYGFIENYYDINGAISSTRTVIPQPYPAATQGVGAIDDFTIDLKKGFPYSTDEGGLGKHVLMTVSEK